MNNSQRQTPIRAANSEFGSDKQYSSNPLSQFQSHFSNYVYQYPVEKKQEVNETINSEQSLPSMKSHDDIHQLQQNDPSIARQSSIKNYQDIIHQRIESQDNSMQQPLQHNIHIELPYDIQQKDVKSEIINNQVRDLPLFQPVIIAQPSQQKVMDRSFDGISAVTSMSSKKYGSKLSKNSFYYDRIGNQTSEVLPPALESNIKYILNETIVPLVIVMTIYVINYFLQKQIDDYCYISDICKCQGFGAQLWSWFKQIMFKLALIIYRKLILCRLAMGSNNLQHKEPIMEYTLLILITLGIDFIIVVWVEQNSDFTYIVMAYVVGIVVLLNTFRIRDWKAAIIKGIGIFSYDICLIGLVLYILYGIPNMLLSLQNHQGRSSGLQAFYYLYPLIDWSMEIFIDWFLGQVQFGELYLYQVQLLIIGIRVGILNLVLMTTFEFWYMIIMLGIIRANNSSMFLTVFLRRWLYYLLPVKFQFLTKMNETRKALKGKHGAYFEHQLWIVFFYFFYLTQTSVPFIAKSTIYIQNCQFSNNKWDYVLQPYQPIIVWILLMQGTLLGYFLNKKSQYDNIKYFGGTQFNLFENVLIRLAGYYFFQFGVMIPFVVKQLNDINQFNQHSLVSTTIQI